MSKESRKVLGIVDAYESGFGYGYEGREHDNPYKIKDHRYAWYFGYERGKEAKNREQPQQEG